MVEDHDMATLKPLLRDYFQKGYKEQPSLLPEGIQAEVLIKSSIDQLASPWMQYFISYDPAASLRTVKCPVLAINGEKDLQVPSKINLSSIEKYLKEGGNNKVTIKEFPNLNHLFQESTTGSPAEYATIEQTFSPVALLAVSDWILTQVK